AHRHGPQWPGDEPDCQADRPALCQGSRDPRGDPQPPGGRNPRLRPVSKLLDSCGGHDAAARAADRARRRAAGRGPEGLAMTVGPPPSGGGGVLVIGYGNTLRAVDGLGPRVAMAAASWEFPGLMAIAVPQLPPELAEPLAAAELAIFVDARLPSGEASVEILPLVPSGARGTLGHASDPRALLALARAIYGRAPRSWL